MLTKFLNFINNEDLFDTQNSLLLAISGGKDSVVLLDILLKTNFKPALVHCNFNLRGSDSDEDEKFVKELSIKHGLKCITNSFNTKKYAIENDLSTQMAARNLRYGWFNELLKEHKLDYLLTAHHLDDSFETSIYNLTKGTGISGLRGIVPKNEKIVRPLLCFTRDEIDNYASQHDIVWREDVSNASTDYSRNFIRHKIIPELKELNPNLIQTFFNTSKRLLSTERLVKKAVDTFDNATIKKKGQTDIPFHLIANTEVVVLDEYFKNYGFNFDQIVSLVELVSQGSSGKKIMTKEYELLIDREIVILTKINTQRKANVLIRDSDSSITVENYKLTFSKTNDISINADPTIEKVDYGLLNFPLQIRNWQEGDTFYPLGMKGKKKLSDFMIDEKIPLNLKSSILVLISNDEIVSILGYRIDNRYKLTSKSKLAFQIEIEHD